MTTPAQDVWTHRALRAGFDLAEKIVPGALLPSLEPARLIQAAKVDPSPAAREGLKQLMAALAKDSELSLFGRLSIRWDMIRLLRNAALVEDALRDDPALAAREVAAPVFILGLPRSGTTFLHSLMAEDEANLVPRNWQTIYPAPRPPGFNAAQDKAARTVDRQLKLFAGLAPGFAGLHPIHADSPQECSEITSHVFQSLRFDTTFRVPDYMAWLEAGQDLEAFEFHKKFLQYLQKGLTGRWVLKCPDHTFSLDSILRVYPDARFVVVHRDPVDMLGSVAHLTEVLRSPFLRNIDAGEIGRDVSARWVDGAARLVDFDQRQEIPAARKIHLQYAELTARPMEAIAAIYAQFGLTLSETAEAAMRRMLTARPDGGYAKHAPYSLKRFNISADALRGRFASYVNTYCGTPS